MDFLDKEIEQLKSDTVIEDFIILITKYLCGKTNSPYLKKEDKVLLNKLFKNASKRSLNYNQLREILLLLNQNTINEDFFNFFFEEDAISLDELKKGIVKFRGFALLCFGNFRMAYEIMSKKPKSEIKDCISPYFKKSSEQEKELKDRPKKMLDIDEISKEDTWFTGYLLINKHKREIKRCDEEIDKTKNGKNIFQKEELIRYSECIQNRDNKIIETQRKALLNTDVYLTWDYMDVYIATSMRNKWEFEETYDFINNVFHQEPLSKLNLRYFNPTKSLCGNVRDKGLLEGLMLKRADCTIYLAQESDTMGKDSELAATLAQRKPVIAYVPKYDSKFYSKKIYDYPLDFFKKRFFILQAEERFDDEDLIHILKKYSLNYEKIIESFLEDLDQYRKNQPFTLWSKKDDKWKANYKNFRLICDILAEGECYNFDKRADLLKIRHPLSMQLDLQSGVANGVLVVRNTDDCAALLYRILTNKMKFKIIHKTYPNKILKKEEGFTFLIEEISESAFRIVTDQERLTNTYWNLFL